MALCRCKEMHANPRGRNNSYVMAVEPVGYPNNTSSICGISETNKRLRCENPGLIWLTEEEAQRYNKGERIFKYATNSTKVKVK